MYNLTNDQKTLTKWLAENCKDGNLTEEFTIVWHYTAASLSPHKAVSQDYRLGELPSIVTPGALDALVRNDLLFCDVTLEREKRNEIKRRCVLTGRAYEAVDNDFDAPDTSFLKHLNPLTDISGFDRELKERCLPMLSAGGSDPKLWDSAVRTAGVILEERLRDVGRISDPNVGGRDLVNRIFNPQGTLASKFVISSERESYRDLYAGIVGAFRNPSAHRLIDPSPEEGGAFIVFVNLLLRKLEALR